MNAVPAMEASGMLTPGVMRQLGALWGKSDAAGRPTLLLAHLLDSAAVGERIWDHWLAPTLRGRLDQCAGGRGRTLLAWLCGVHDLGKATPAFQNQVPELATAVTAAGLPIRRLPPAAAGHWRHDRAGGKILRDAAREVGWSRANLEWVWPLLAGHHGTFPSRSALTSPAALGPLHGNDSAWSAVQRSVLEAVTVAVGFNGLADAEPTALPSRADQLALSGVIVMADWIASDASHFPGLDELADVDMNVARRRAARVWHALGLRGGWDADLLAVDGDVVGRRFAVASRPVQAMVVDAARSMPAPGLLVVEAPTGEGKTEAALAAAEVLAARFGADGVFVGMPTQATCDPMFTRVRRWVGEIDAAAQVALLHGKRRFNEEWRRLVEVRQDAHPTDAAAGTDDSGVPDPYIVAFGGVDEGGDHRESGGDAAPAEWFLGRKRGLLTPFVVGTIDQLLHAATRTKHVMLRYAGLAGKVVVLDEIHAADVYMRQFVDEALRWLGHGRVPVVLLSATLPPALRHELADGYLQGATGVRHASVVRLPAVGYPGVTAVTIVDGTPTCRVASTTAWRPPTTVAVEVIDEEPDDVAAAAGRVRDELTGGGCALVIRNTVARAQRTYQLLSADFGDDVVLLHARLSAGHRADRAEQVLEQLGAPGPSRRRPRRLVVVATQLAEQSFDVDADLVVTDLAPIDLLAQRIGRLHRHDRPASQRPPSLQRPRVIVTGYTRRGDVPPVFAAGSTHVYPEVLLLRTAVQVDAAAHGSGWRVPDDVPGLVAAVYSDAATVPAAWQTRAAAAAQQLRADNARRVDNAEPFLLVRHGEWAKPTLEGLHRGQASAVVTDDDLRAVVRDGDDTVEVVLVRRDELGYRTLGGAWLGANGELGPDLVTEVLSGTVRLPARLTADAVRLPTLPEWRDRPWLRYCRVVELDAGGHGTVGSHDVAYDRQLGLLVGGRSAGPAVGATGRLGAGGAP